jgi:hypothetical protein
MSESTPRSPSVPPPRPRWVKVLFAVVAVLVVLVVVMVLTGGEHTPGRHLGGDTNGHQPREH